MEINNLPQSLIKLLDERNDIKENYQKLGESFLIKWILNHGLKEYPKLFEGNFNNNELLNWMSKPIVINNNEYLPRIIFAFWLTISTHKRKYRRPGKSKLYLNFIFNQWFYLSSKFSNLPKYNSIFKSNPDNIFKNKIINLFISFIWFLRKRVINIQRYIYLPHIKDCFLNFKKSFIMQFNVIDGLVYRELKTRVSEGRFGILGVFVEPLGVMLVFLVLFSLIRSKGTLDIFIFLGVGIVFFTLFQDIAIRSANAMLANEALFFYRPVKPIDTVIGRTIVETGLYTIVFICIISFAYLKNQEIFLFNFTLLFLSMVSLIIFSFSIGLILMVITFIYPQVNQFIPLLMRPLWFISGIFISLQNIPQWLRPYLSWNPIFQAIELGRHSFSQDYVINNSDISLNYLFFFSMITLVVSLFIYKNNQKRLLTR